MSKEWRVAIELTHPLTHLEHQTGLLRQRESLARMLYVSHHEVIVSRFDTDIKHQD